ncbi:hypothetical protein BH09MYX1_BH09MYX1_63560 [soil metagenome]
MSTEPEANVELANSIEQLSSLYRGELAAVQTYVSALCHASLGRYGDVLRRQKRVHEERVSSLSARLRDLGAKAPASSGAWGTFVRLVEDAAATFSPEMALAVLEEEEDSLAHNYRAAVPMLDDQSRTLVLERLLPAQNVTHYVVRRVHETAA